MTEDTSQELVNQLVALLELETIDIDLYRGPITQEPWIRVFGGQVVGQALKAACNTIDNARPPHSLHAYFMRPGDPRKPIIYEVFRDRDGGTFSSRRVVAKQNGLPILNLSCSFEHIEQGLNHQFNMPDVPTPEHLQSREEFLKDNIDRFPIKMRPHLLEPRPLEIRSVFNEVESQSGTLVQHYWFKLKAPIENNQILQRVMLAYISDYTLLGACLLPHGHFWFDENMQVASLDHAVWFHDDLDLSQWHLYTQDSPWAGGGRGLNRGMIYNQSGKLVANVMQEALIRVKN